MKKTIIFIIAGLAVLLCCSLSVADDNDDVTIGNEDSSTIGCDVAKGVNTVIKETPIGSIPGARSMGRDVQDFGCNNENEDDDD